MIMTMIIAMGIQQKQSHGQELMGRCTIAMMGWHHTHTSPSTLLATSAEELHHSSPGISMKGLLLLASADQLVLGNCPSFNCVIGFDRLRDELDCHLLGNSAYGFLSVLDIYYLEL